MEVEEWVAGHETVQAMLRRVLPCTSANMPLVAPLQRVSMHAHDVLEVAGPSGSAKSEFLLQCFCLHIDCNPATKIYGKDFASTSVPIVLSSKAAVKCLLPKRGFGGWEGGVLWYDLDGHFDMLRLLRLLRTQIHQGIQQRQGEGLDKEVSEDNVEDGDQVFNACLERFLYTRCYNSFDFLVALQTSRSQLIKAQSQGKGVRLLLIDSIAAFYWLDRAGPSSAGANTDIARLRLSVQGVMQAVVRELRGLSQSHGLLVMATKCGIYSSNPSDTADWDTSKSEAPWLKDSRKSGLQHREFLPAVWQEYVTHRLLLNVLSSAGDAGVVFTAEWLTPALSRVDKFTIHDVSSFGVDLALNTSSVKLGHGWWIELLSNTQSCLAWGLMCKADWVDLN